MFEALLDVLFPLVLLSLPAMGALFVAKLVFGTENVIWACKTSGRWIARQGRAIAERLSQAITIMFGQNKIKDLFEEYEDLRSRYEDLRDAYSECEEQLQQLYARVDELEQASQAIETQVEAVAGPF